MMPGQLEGKRVVLTGASANIGRATALLFAAEGARLVIGDVDAPAEGTAEEVRARGGDAIFVQTDVSSSSDVQTLMTTAAERLGGIDVIVNNAGVQFAGMVTEFDESLWDTLMEVNARSCFLAAKHGIPHLRKSVAGVIVNTASLAAVEGGPGLTGYSASKGAIVAFTRALAMEVAPDGIRANALCPGWVDTSFNEPAIVFMGGREKQEQVVAAGVPLGRQATSEEISKAMLFLASDMSSYMTGQILVIDGGVS